MTRRPPGATLGPYATHCGSGFAEGHYPAQRLGLACGVSAGVVTLHPQDDSQTLAALADSTLYRAKKAGRNQVQSALNTPSRASELPAIEA